MQNVSQHAKARTLICEPTLRLYGTLSTVKDTASDSMGLLTFHLQWCPSFPFLQGQHGDDQHLNMITIRAQPVL